MSGCDQSSVCCALGMRMVWVRTGSKILVACVPGLERYVINIAFVYIWVYILSCMSIFKMINLMPFVENRGRTLDIDFCACGHFIHLITVSVMSTNALTLSSNIIAPTPRT